MDSPTFLGDEGAFAAIPMPSPTLPRLVSEIPHSGSGFLPEEIDDHVIELSGLLGFKLVLLIGEPGSGKSIAARSIVSHGARIHFEDLRFHRETTIELTLRDAVKSPPDVLVLDSIDEWSDSMPKLVRVLQNVVFPAVRSGMRLICTCRSADVHRSLQEALRSLSRRLSDKGDKAGFAFHLLPLRRSDASAYIDEVGLDAEQVLESLDSFGALDLASNVGLLDLLCQTVQADGAVLGSRAELFRSAVARAMDLADKSVDERLGSATEVSWLGEVAELAAALTLVTGRPAVRVQGLPLHSEVPLESLVGDWGLSRAVALEDIRLVLDSPVFAQVGNGRQVAHKSLGSYLLARFIAGSELSQQQVQSLVATPEEVDVRPAIVSQLREACAWLLTADPSRFEWLVELDAFGIAKYAQYLDSDLLRKRTASALIEQAAEALSRRSWGDSFEGLAFPGLIEVLRDGLLEEPESQLIALQIARDAEVTGLEQEVRELVVADETPFQVRRMALRVLVDCGAAESVQEDAASILESDQDNEFLGLLIEGLWPTSWSADELISVLRSPKFYYTGAYDMALQDIGKNVAPEDAAVLLQWCADQPASEDVEDVTGENWITGIAKRTLQELSPDDVAAVIAPVAAAFWLIVRTHKPIPLSLATWPEDTRRLLLREIVRTAPNETAIYYLGHTSDVDGAVLATLVSIDWVVDQIGESDEPIRSHWARLLERRMSPMNPEDLELAWRVRESPGGEVFANWFDAVEIESELANRMRKHAEFETSHVDHKNEQSERESYIAGQVLEHLEKCESEPESFWEFLFWFDAGTLELDTDLLLKAERLELDATTRDDVLKSAENYLLGLEPSSSPEYTPGRLTRPLVAACRSATTLLTHSPTSLDRLSQENWESLVVPVLTFPYYLANQEVEASPVEDIASRLLREVPEFVVARAGDLISTLDEAGEEFRGLALLAAGEPDVVKRLVTDHLSSVSDVNREQLLRLGLKCDFEATIEECQRTIDTTSSVEEAAMALTLLADEFPSIAGSSFLDLYAREPKLAQEVGLRIAPARHWQSFAVVGMPEQMAQLYEVWRDMFPPEEDVLKEGVSTVLPRDDAAGVRDSFLGTLISEATLESVQALRSLRQRRSTWNLTRQFVEARELLYQSIWSPLSDPQLRLMIHDSRRRVVRSHAELREVTLDALTTIEGWLTGETPQAFALWDARKVPGTPKDENSISDWYCHGLRLLLAGRGVIVNREVEVTRGTGAGMGSRNDIRIEATADSETFTVVIETKGCWNQKLRDGLVDQLDRRYLSNAGLTHGIYLVVCFPPEQYVNPPSFARHTRQTLDRRLAGYANSIVNDIQIVVQEARLPIPLTSA